MASAASAFVDSLFSLKPKASAEKDAAPKAAPAPVMARRALTGLERASILLLALGEKYGSSIWKLLDDEEIRMVSLTMSSLGTIEAESVEKLLVDFVGQLSTTGALMGDSTATERLLSEFLPGDRVNLIMEEIRGPAGRNMWEKLSNVQEEVLASYLKNEYPQTVAVVLSK